MADRKPPYTSRDKTATNGKGKLYAIDKVTGRLFRETPEFFQREDPSDFLFPTQEYVDARMSIRHDDNKTKQINFSHHGKQVWFRHPTGDIDIVSREDYFNKYMSNPRVAELYPPLGPEEYEKARYDKRQQQREENQRVEEEQRAAALQSRKDSILTNPLVSTSRHMINTLTFGGADKVLEMGGYTKDELADATEDTPITQLLSVFWFVPVMQTTPMTRTIGDTTLLIQYINEEAKRHNIQRSAY